MIDGRGACEDGECVRKVHRGEPCELCELCAFALEPRRKAGLL